MADCPQCGKPIPEGQEICPTCGVKPTNLSAQVDAHINLLKKKIEEEPSNIKLYLELGDLYKKHGFSEEALVEYQKAAKIDNNNFNAQIESAHIFLKFKKLREAESAFSIAYHVNPNSTEALIGLFRAYYLQNKIDEAIVLGEKIVKSKPGNAEFHMLMKNLYKEKGNEEKVLMELKKLEQLNPNNEHVVKEIAQYYKKGDDTEKAIEYYYKMLNLGIEDIDLGIHIGKYYYENQEYDKVIVHLNDLLKEKDITPEKDTLIRTYLALAYFNRGKIPDAKNLVDKMHPSHAQQMDQETQKKLALIFFKIGQSELTNNKSKQAIASFEKAVAYDKETVEYGQILDKTKNDIDISKQNLLKKISVVGLSALAALIFIVLVWILIRNRIIIQIEHADDVAVLIDGKSVKTRPGKPGIISSPVLFMGKHDIVIEKPGYEKWEGSANIGIGRPAKLQVDLVPIYSFLQLTSVPESAKVIIDGQFVGETPFASDQILTCPHVIELNYDGHKKWQSTLEINEKDSIDLGIIRLKNLGGKWYGKIGKETYAYNPGFSMTITQYKNTLTIQYYHKLREDCKYSGKIKGRIENGEFYAEGNVTYRYLDVFYWAKTKKKIVMRGKISDDWNRIEGKHSTEGLAEEVWWANHK